MRRDNRNRSISCSSFADQHRLVLVYDGECPFCRSYVHLATLRRNWTIHLLDARSPEAAHSLSAEEIRAVSRDMLLRTPRGDFWGGEAMWALARIRRGRGIPDVRQGRLSRGMYRLGYPVLRAGRTLALAVMGKSVKLQP